MPHNSLGAKAERLEPYLRPWTLILAGLLLTGVAYSLPEELGKASGFAVALPVVLGTMLALIGIWRQFRIAGWDFVERIETAAMIAVTGSTALVAWFAMQKYAWDSGKIFYAAMFIASLLGVALVLSPPIGRRIILSLVLIFHFGGILTAVTYPDPPNNTGPWLSKQSWTYVYRPYLSFVYMTNAYHFYSPNPSTPSQYRFAVMYDDGTYDWVNITQRENSPIGMHYQRMLALPEHTFRQLPSLPATESQLNWFKINVDQFREPELGSWEARGKRREIGSGKVFPATVNIGGQKERRELPIPLIDVSTLNAYSQYCEPDDGSKQMIESIAKRMLLVARTKDNGAKPRTIKMYRVVHSILSPREFAEGADPYELTRYLPYFLGEFDSNGKLVRKPERDHLGNVREQHDPFLYWYLPIIKVEENYPNNLPGVHIGQPILKWGVVPKKGYILDCMDMHAAGEIRIEKQPKQEDKQ